jgi:hypothetical protein
MFQTKVEEKIKTHILRLITFFQKYHTVDENVQKYGTDTQATDGNIIWLIHFACWINKGTNTHSEFVIHFLQKIFS